MKYLTQKETEYVVQRLKEGASINAIKNETNRGVNILKRVCKEAGLIVQNMQSRRGQVKENFLDTFKKNSKVGNCRVVSGIKKYNLIPHEKCYNCGLSDWLNGALVLELDHVNGDNSDNRLDNLRFLCPNCHSQTPTYKGRNINKGIKKISDEQLTNALKKEGNIRKALIKVGLSPKGGNYERAYRLLNTT